MSLHVSKVSVHRYFDAVPRLAGHKGICSITLNHHFALNNIIVTRPRREVGSDEKPELTIKYPVLRNFVQSQKEGYDMHQRHIVDVIDEALDAEIREKILETFNQGYLDALPYLKDGIPVPQECRPTFTMPWCDLPVPEFTDIRFYKYIPARAEAPSCRFDTYVFSFCMDGIVMCEARFVLRPQGNYVAVPIQRKYESASGAIINKDRTSSIVAPISRKCRAALEKAADTAFTKFCRSDMILDDGTHLPKEDIVRAEQRRKQRA